MGLISVHDQDRPQADEDLEKWKPAAWIFGVTNAFISYPKEFMTAKDIEEIIESHDDYYLFKRHRSCIIRIRPGHSSDSQWDQPPIGHGG
jgi:hypothetical protein